MRIDPRAAFTIALAAGLAAAIYTARDWPVETRMLPWCSVSRGYCWRWSS